jgi:engulfment/cell motility protein 1
MAASDEIIYTEWLDGLNLLLPGGFIATKETADLVQALTDVGVKIRLLDLTGERLEIPTVIPTPIVPPPSVPFYYSE